MTNSKNITREDMTMLVNLEGTMVRTLIKEGQQKATGDVDGLTRSMAGFITTSVGFVCPIFFSDKGFQIPFYRNADGFLINPLYVEDGKLIMGQTSRTTMMNVLVNSSSFSKEENVELAIEVLNENSKSYVITGFELFA